MASEWFNFVGLAFLLLNVFDYINVSISHEEISRVLLISLDGFRWDYIDMANKKGCSTPNFQMLIDNGVLVTSPGNQNVFITKTFPNHYSLVTGLYEESHGLVANEFYDPVFNETFTFHNQDHIKWWNGTGTQRVEPIWLTNDAVGDEHHASGVFFWPGSEVKGNQPKHFMWPYNESVPFSVRADTVAGWFIQESGPINFGVLYYHEPDATGHKHGPDSVQMVDMICTLDGYVGYLIKILKEKNIFDELNIILTSDHGMTGTNEDVYIDDYVDSSLYTWYGGSPVANVLPKPGTVLFVLLLCHIMI